MINRTELDYLSQMCAISYLREDAAIYEFERLGFKALALHERAGQLDEAFLLQRDAHAIVVIRGTDEPLDWIRRNLVTFRPLFRSQVHPGFRAGAVAIYQRLRQTLYGIKTIDVIGHSKGGAIAAILGQMLDKHYEVKIRTLATPLFCRAAHADQYQSDFIQVINPRDAVPRIPFRCFGFVECGTVVVWDGLEFDPLTLDQAIKKYPTRSLLWGMLRGGLRYHFDYGAALLTYYTDGE
jgi:hypothetical protein